MSDDFDLVKLGTHALAGGGGAGLVAGFMRWLYGRDVAQREEAARKEAALAREEFVSLRGDVKHLIAAVDEHKKVFEDVVETKLSMKALHARLDDNERRLERLEVKRR